MLLTGSRAVRSDEPGPNAGGAGHRRRWCRRRRCFPASRRTRPRRVRRGVRGPMGRTVPGRLSGSTARQLRGRGVPTPRGRRRCAGRVREISRPLSRTSRCKAHPGLAISGRARTSGPGRRDISSEVGDYAACQRVAATAHQLEYHGIFASAATGLGETLAIFRQRVGIAELPVIIDEQSWLRLPPRPGPETVRLTIVGD